MVIGKVRHIKLRSKRRHLQTRGEREREDKAIVRRIGEKIKTVKAGNPFDLCEHYQLYGTMRILREIFEIIR